MQEPRSEENNYGGWTQEPLFVSFFSILSSRMAFVLLYEPHVTLSEFFILKPLFQNEINRETISVHLKSHIAL